MVSWWMPNEHGSNERLLVEINNTLTDTERLNQQRHVELVAAIRGKSDILGRLNALRSRLSRVAKAVAALDAQTQ